MKKSTKLTLSVIAITILLGGCGEIKTNIDNPFESNKKDDNKDINHQEGVADDVSNRVIINPKIIGEIDTRDAEGVSLSPDGTKLLVSDYGGGIKIVDVANDPTHPTIRGSLDLDGMTINTSISNDGTKALALNDNLNIIDISNVANPIVLGTFKIDMDARDAVFSKDETKAYIADGYNGLKIINISDAYNPMLIGGLEVVSSSSPADISRKLLLSKDGTKIYMVNEDEGLIIIDVSSPKNPTFYGRLKFADGESNDIALSSDETKAYIASGTKGLRIIDISDPSNPHQIGSIKTAIEKAIARGVVVSKDNTKAYIADSDEGLKIVDISDATNPVLKSIVDTDDAYDVELSKDGKKVYIADEYSGIKIIALGKFGAK